ncbi:hypothetical protein CK489_08215 [Bradyrhizobium sp. UFLA03-84]|nr:hypothetical protein CK489_08215 [Bradyrhizobium sp. UFLA03-84]
MPDQRVFQSRDHFDVTSAGQNAFDQDRFFASTRRSRIKSGGEIAPKISWLVGGMTLFHALSDCASEPIAKRRAIANRRIKEAIESLVLSPRGNQFVAVVIERAIVGDDADSVGKPPKHAGEAERGGRLEIGGSAYRPLMSKGASHFLDSGHAEGFGGRILGSDKGFDDKPFPYKPRRRNPVSGNGVPVPFVANASANRHCRNKTRITHSHGDRGQ